MSFITAPNKVLGGTYYVVEIYRITLVGYNHEYDCVYTRNIVNYNHGCNFVDTVVIKLATLNLWVLYKQGDHLVNCSYPIYDFCLWCGEDKEIFLTFSHTDSEGNRQPMVLDNCRFEMTLVLKRSREVFDRLTSETGRLVTGVLEDGVFTASSKDATVLQVRFPHDVTIQFDEVEALYELFKIDPAGKWEMLLAGEVAIHGGGYV